MNNVMIILLLYTSTFSII